MNVSGINPVASLSGLEMPVNISMAASVKVLDMAQETFAQVAEQLIAEMAAAITGVGTTIDVYA